ncbi:hypothetical protein [Microtetraspora malaysiensis]|uniref:BP74-related protein n=1 Tax=Microtetraspora malaysiensis TaxID=161358 RepID=UPI003D932B9E
MPATCSAVRHRSGPTSSAGSRSGPSHTTPAGVTTTSPRPSTSSTGPLRVCDATIPYVEDHLDEAGGAFLPGLVWCPWSSRLVREVPTP